MSEQTSRVTMIWPDTLKERVRERVGGRGLTAFAIEAVSAKLGTHDAHQADSKELNEVKDLAQRMADALAMGGDYEDRLSTLRLLELPAWIQTVGWPDDLVAAVRPEDSTPEPVIADPEPEPEPEQPVTDEPSLPAIGDPGTIRSAPPAPPKGGDLMERIRTKAAEKGVDLSAVDLKPASALEEPAAPSAEQVAQPIANPNACPKCGTELVNGECWECFA